MNSKVIALDEEHWNMEAYRQRMARKEWDKLLLNYEDKIIFKGKVIQLVAKNLTSIESYRKQKN